MRVFTPRINVSGIDRHGLSSSTDLVDWILIGYINDLKNNIETARLNDKVLFSANEFIKNFPMSGLKGRTSVSKRISKLKGLNLITVEYKNGNQLFVENSAVCNEILSELEPNDVSEIDFVFDVTKKQKINDSLRLKVYERDGYQCLHCGTNKDLSLDHIHPESKGGATTVENLQTLCRSCNSKKGASL